MTDIIIRGALAAELQKLAQEQQLPVEDLLEQAVETLRHNEPVQTNSNRAALLLMAKKAEEAGFRVGRDDVSENFDEILNQLVSEDLRKRRGDGNAE